MTNTKTFKAPRNNNKPCAFTVRLIESVKPEKAKELQSYANYLQDKAKTA